MTTSETKMKNSLSNQALGAYLKSYNDFLSKHT